MNFPTFLLLILAGLIVAARTKFHGIPVLWLIAVIVVLALAALVLYLVRLTLLEYRPPHPAYRQPQPVYVVTTLH